MNLVKISFLASLPAYSNEGGTIHGTIGGTIDNIELNERQNILMIYELPQILKEIHPLRGCAAWGAIPRAIAAGLFKCRPFGL